MNITEIITDQSKERKPSIFSCKQCKNCEIKVERKKKPEDLQKLIKLQPAKNTNIDQKYIIKINGKIIPVGYVGFSDFTLNKSETRKQQYLEKNEKHFQQFWKADQSENISTQSFWNRYLLWEQSDIFEAIKHIEEMTGAQIKFTKKTIEKHQRKMLKAVKSKGEDIDY